MLGSLFFAGAAVAAIVQGNCTQRDLGLKWLATVLSPNATISCKGQAGQLFNANRYWGVQFGEDAGVVIFPRNTQDVSYAVQASQKSPLGREEYAFVSGAHSMANSSTSSKFVIDLLHLNTTRVVKGFSVGKDSITAIQYGGGTTTAQFESQLNGTGYTGVSARVGSVGLGGFSTGGGVGFIAGAYGYASDRLVALEVVLPSGQIVFATEDNQYSDLLWAFKGAGLGQFGIITTFYQRAAPVPRTVRLGFSIMANNTANIERSFANTVEFFNDHKDPYSLMYYSFGYLPTDLSNLNPRPQDFALQNIVSTVYFDDPENADQPSYNATFAKLLDGLKSTTVLQYTVSYAELSVIGEGFFPYGLRRGFYGPQTTNISIPYIRGLQTQFHSWVSGAQERGDFPASSLFVLQYMTPGLNGNLPKKDSDTAWPHSIAGHQTLFDPGYLLASTDGFQDEINNGFNQLTYKNQASIAGESTGVCGGLHLCDYPNYISPDVPGKQVWGANIKKLIRIKQKYDPLCTLHTGRVFASPGCIVRGLANVYP